MSTVRLPVGISASHSMYNRSFSADDAKRSSSSAEVPVRRENSANASWSPSFRASARRLTVAMSVAGENIWFMSCCEARWCSPSAATPRPVERINMLSASRNMKKATASTTTARVTSDLSNLWRTPFKHSSNVSRRDMLCCFFTSISRYSRAMPFIFKFRN